MAYTNIEEYVAELKRRVRIEDVIEETIALERHSGHGWTRGSGRGAGVHSLVVDMDRQRFAWNGNGEYGGGRYNDVIFWVETRDHVDFFGALRTLAKRAGMPEWEQHETDPAKRLAFRVQMNAFDIAQELFEKWLLDDEQAMEYLKDRGIHENTIRLVMYGEEDKHGTRRVVARGAGLGFSGRGGDRSLERTATARYWEEMQSALQAGGVPLDSPAAVALMGLREWNKLKGAEAVTGWCEANGIEPKGRWISNGRIPSMLGVPGIIFPHIHGGAVQYFSRRNIPPFDEQVNEDGETEERKSYNLPNELVGGRKELYYNHCYYSKATEVVIVEGQMDAVTQGQYGYAAVATAGVGWQNEHTQKELARLAKQHGTLYLAYDRDGKGQEAIIGKENDYPIANVVGGMARVIEWPDKKWTRPNGKPKAVKDANDLRQWARDTKVEDGEEAKILRGVLNEARPIALKAASAAGRLAFGSAEKIAATKRVIEIIARIEDRLVVEQLRTAFGEALQIGIREFKNLLATARKEKVDEDDGKPGEIVETFGGWIRTEDGKGWLLEYIYDPAKNEAMFAYRNPERRFGTAKYVDINGIRYTPREPDSVIIEGAVMFPSGLGELVKERELAAEIELFLRRYVLFDNPLQYRLASYYVMLTYLYDCFPAIPYLRARGGTDTGKTEVMLRIGYLCYRLIISTGISTTASYKDAIDTFRGVLFMDEMDISDKFDDRGVLLNVGYKKKTGKVWKMVEVMMPDGTRRQRSEMAYVYGPKIITMYGRFKDDATENRCVTFEMSQHSPLELKKKGIPQELPPRFYTERQAVVNKLLRWRLEKWQADEFSISEDLTDYTISTRHNEVIRPLKYIAKDDDSMLKDIEMFARSLYHHSVMKRSQGLDARVLDAVIAISENEKYSKYLFQGELNGFGTVKYAFTRDIAVVANEVMDEMNLGDGEGDAEEEQKAKRRGKSLTTKTTGSICEDTLMLPSHRMGKGFVIVFDEDKLEVAKIRYGLTDALRAAMRDDDAGLDMAKNAAATRPENLEQGEMFEDEVD
ncbi:MAG: toprim domain-containing protein [Chloroflexota bacterium]